MHLPGGIPEERVAYRLEGYIPAGEEGAPGALPVRAGEKYVPLYEGRMVHQFDQCQKAYVSGSGRRANWQELELQEKRIVPHYFVSEQDFRSLRPAHQIFRAGFLEVTGQGNERSALCSMIPDSSPCGHKVLTAKSDNGILGSILFTCFLDSFILDFLLRKIVSNSISYFLLYSLPVPRIDLTDNEAVVLFNTAGLLSCTTPEMAGLWDELARQWPQDFPLPWSRERACLDVRSRARLRADIDARVARLYGLTAHEYALVLSTFPLLDRDQPPLPGDVFIRMTNRGEKVEPRSFITRDLALLTFLELTEQGSPADIVAFFADAGVDIARRTGPIRDLRERVTEATRRGAVAYIPSTRQGWSPDSLYLPPDLPSEAAHDRDVAQDTWMDTDPQINGGTLTFRGTDISVGMIYDLLQEGWTFPQVLTSYPQLTMAHVALALRWGQGQS